MENDYRLRSVYDHRVTDCLSKHPPLYLSDQEKDEQQHKEEILLLRIRNLIEQCNSYEAEQKARSEKKSHPSVCDRNETADE